MRFPLRLARTALAIAASAVVCSAQTPTPTPTPTAPATPPAQAAAATAPTPPAGFRGEFLRELADIERKYISLAEAIPADKFTWRPGEGVRSISEVFMHVAAANLNLPRLIGTPPPAGFTPRGYETSATEKASVTEALRQSFAHLRQAALRVADADSERTFPWFGGTTNTYRGHFLFMTRHLAEHLGQMIAYARMNGVVPAWTEERQRQQQQQPQQQRPPTQPQQPAQPPTQPRQP